MAIRDRALPLAQAPAEGACCGACASAAVAAEAAGTGHRSDPDPPGTFAIGVGTRRPVLDRSADRRIAFAGILLAVGFVATAAVAAVIGAAGRGTVWLPLHLALAGGAGTAIAAVLPFFTVALAVAPPSGRRMRVAAIGLVAGGAVVVSAAVAVGDASMGHVGGSIYVAGIIALGIAAFRPLRGALGPRRRLVERAYALALVIVAVSATLATAYLSGWAPIVERWAVLKPAHAWLNLVGFLSLVIVATLIHLAPTVEGGRIRSRATARLAVVALATGVPLVALGYASGADAVGRLGAIAVLIGALAVPAHAAAVWRDRGRWTTDRDWHRLTAGSLRAATAWFALAMAVAAGRVLWLGPIPAAWAIELIAIPFTVGWAIQVLIGASSHLVPAIGPGGPVTHARQRARLGRLATARLVALQAGVGALWLGSLAQDTALGAIGGVLVGVALAATIGSLMAAALARDADGRAAQVGT